VSSRHEYYRSTGKRIELPKIMGVVDDAVSEREGRGPRAAKFERRATTLMQVGGGESALCCFFTGVFSVI
jgi:hypothetical protein